MPLSKDNGFEQLSGIFILLILLLSNALTSGSHKTAANAQ